jgi:glutamate synthase (NADPH/NADH) small chain
MAKPNGFLEEQRRLPERRPVSERAKDYYEVEGPVQPELTVKQATRCMDCGVPFCHHGCPLGNIIPEFNDAVFQGNWKLAYEILISTNNFPEFTGRICPAPCEASCVLGINNDPVAIEYIEKTIIEKAFDLGYATPRKPGVRTGKTVAIVGSGPAGLAAAAQLNQAGHRVTVFERADEMGGLLRYGIPDFKLDKQVLDRRLRLLEEEGIAFVANTEVGTDLPAGQVREAFDALLLCGGAGQPRDLPVPGRDAQGVHFAMEFLSQQNRRVAGKRVEQREIWATGKHVVVIGGGDTGSDCVGTAVRHGAAGVTQLEIMPVPPLHRTPKMPWPHWPVILRTSTSHEEGCDRQWSLLTKAFEKDEAGKLTGLRVADVTLTDGKFSEVPGTERVLPCELALLALGFTGPARSALLTDLALDLDDRGNVKCRRYHTSAAGVFAAGDMRRGQSLVVWAISEGREAARAIDEYLMGASVLEEKERGVLALR